jgi:2-polyprenyl-3-methyl-5-hydroxy-6-metoxy-1,4-benzoquinol methylase
MIKKDVLMHDKALINPHFDHNRVIWKDEYSGLYEPVDYSEQFDDEWRLFLENKTGFKQHTGVEIDDVWINDRIFDLTGVENLLSLSDSHDPRSQTRDTGGRQNLDLRFSPGFFQGKRCLDAACGAGRWTKTLLALGAKVKSIDVSEHGLESVRRFNDDVECLDIFDIPQRRDLHETFDFTICWGVVMCTHDPKVAFENVAKTVKPGGGLYIMVYAPTFHNSPEILAYRRHYHNLKTFDEKLAYAYSIADKPENAINYLDMLHTFYNWVVPEETIHHWYHANGFMDVITLNSYEKRPGSYHVFGRKRNYDLPLRDDSGNLMPRISNFDASQTIPLKGPFNKEKGFAWQVWLSEYASTADDNDHPYRSKLILLEDGEPLWLRHTIHDEIRKVGKGCYSHWQDGLIFSTTDNSDPSTNGRTYQIVFAESAD